MTPRIAVADIESLPMTLLDFSLDRQYRAGLDQIIEPPRIGGVGWKWLGGKTEWLCEFNMGRTALLAELHQRMDDADVVIGWNSQRFDIPWIKYELALAGFEPPSPIQQIDLMRAARSQFYMPSYKLDWSVRMFIRDSKLSTGGMSLWRRCMEGDPKAWALMGRYCKHDVDITHGLYRKWLGWLPSHPHMGLLNDRDVDVCSRCDSLGKQSKLQRRGFAYTQLGKFPRYQCTGCGGWSRGKKALATVDARGAA